MTTPAGFQKKLDDALATADDDGFLQQLFEIDPRYDAVDPERRPHPLAMFTGLWALHTDVGLGGIWKYLAQDEGSGFDRDIASCRVIGATKAVEYLEATRRLFPGKRVPKDQDARGDVLDQMEEKAAETGAADPLRALDEKFAGMARAELGQRLRAWVRQNRDELVKELSALPAPGRATAKPTVTMEANALLETLRKEEGEPHEKTVAALRDAARNAGLIPWKGATDDARHARFISSVSSLTQKQWTTVAQRYHANRRAIQQAFDTCFALSQQLRSGQLGDRGVHDARLTRHVEANKALFRITDALPQQTVARGKKVGVLLGAHHAAATAAIAIRLHEWLVLMPRGDELARNAYAPFVGLAWTPDLSPAAPVPRTRKPAAKKKKK